MSGHSLFRKYAVVFVLLVSGALLTSGLVQVYFSYPRSAEPADTAGLVP